MAQSGATRRAGHAEGDPGRRRVLARVRRAAAARNHGGRPQVRRYALTALSLVVFFELFRLPGGAYLHCWEMYHYYVGAKYAPELGYTRLYRCSTVADAEAGIDVAHRWIRNLEDDTLLRASDVVRAR